MATCLPSMTALKAARRGDLGLAVADVAADGAIHRVGASMSSLTSLMTQLVFRLQIGEGGFQFGLPFRVGGEGMAGIVSRVAYRSSSSWASSSALRAGGGFGLSPRSLAQPVRVGLGIVGADPFAQPVGMVDGDVEVSPLAYLTSRYSRSIPPRLRTTSPRTGRCRSQDGQRVALFDVGEKVSARPGVPCVVAGSRTAQPKISASVSKWSKTW